MKKRIMQEEPGSNSERSAMPSVQQVYLTFAS